MRNSSAQRNNTAAKLVVTIFISVTWMMISSQELPTLDISPPTESDCLAVASENSPGEIQFFQHNCTAIRIVSPHKEDCRLALAVVCDDGPCDRDGTNVSAMCTREGCVCDGDEDCENIVLFNPAAFDDGNCCTFVLDTITEVCLNPTQTAFPNKNYFKVCRESDIPMASTDTAANSEVTSTSDNTASAGGKDIFLPITYTNIGVLAFIATGSAIISAMYYIIVVCIPVHMVVGAIIENVLDKLSMRSPPDAAAMAESGMAQQNGTPRQRCK